MTDRTYTSTVHPWLSYTDGAWEADLALTTHGEMERRLIILQELKAGRARLEEERGFTVQYNGDRGKRVRALNPFMAAVRRAEEIAPSGAREGAVLTCEGERFALVPTGLMTPGTSYWTVRRTEEEPETLSAVKQIGQQFLDQQAAEEAEAEIREEKPRPEDVIDVVITGNSVPAEQSLEATMKYIRERYGFVSKRWKGYADQGVGGPGNEFPEQERHSECGCTLCGIGRAFRDARERGDWAGAYEAYNALFEHAGNREQEQAVEMDALRHRAVGEEEAVLALREQVDLLTHRAEKAEEALAKAIEDAKWAGTQIERMGKHNEMASKQLAEIVVERDAARRRLGERDRRLRELERVRGLLQAQVADLIHDQGGEKDQDKYLRGLGETVHVINRAHGFYEAESTVVRDPVTGDVEARVKNPSLPAEKLMLIVTEVAEAMEARRDADRTAEGYELADIIIRTVDYASWQGFDLDDLVAEKVRVNRQRPYKHGRAS